MARQDKYTTNVLPYLAQIPEWYKTMSVRQIALRLGVSKTTLYKYAEDHKELAEALKSGATLLVEDLKCALKKRAMGYEVEEVETIETQDEDGNTVGEITVKTKRKHIPADLGSIHLLLKNLDPDWRNDDAKTMELREREMAVKEKRAEEADW